jgi:hypothetical protein
VVFLLDVPMGIMSSWSAKLATEVTPSTRFFL